MSTPAGVGILRRHVGYPDAVRVHPGRRGTVVTPPVPAGVPALLAVVVRLTEGGADPAAVARLGDPGELVEEIGQDLVALALQALFALRESGEQGPLGH